MNPAGSLARQEVPSAVAGRFPATVCGGGAPASGGLWGGKTLAWEGSCCFVSDSQSPCWGVLCVRASLAQMGSALALGRVPVHSHFVPSLSSLANRAAGPVAELSRG